MSAWTKFVRVWVYYDIALPVRMSETQLVSILNSYLSKWIGCVPDISLVSKDNKTTILLEATHKVT